MGREIKRVPLDWDWPLNKVWDGFLSPDKFDEIPCVGCAEQHHRGYSAVADRLIGQWYGTAPFRPEDNGSTPLTVDHPAVRAFAERNVAHSPSYYGSGEPAIIREAQRLADLWNGMWLHHLNTEDIALLDANDDLRELTHDFDRDRDPRWQRIDPPPDLSPDVVNAMTIARPMFHPSYYQLVKARCAAAGAALECAGCDGHGSHEAYPGQRAEAEAWEPTKPPTGEGWQLWETVSEGSPISPVFPDAEGLAQWLTTPASCWGATKRPMTIEQARGFVGAGWAPSMIGNAGGLHDGAEYIGTEEALRGHAI